MSATTVTPLEALQRLIGAASLIDADECKDEAIYGALQNELVVAREVAKELAAAPQSAASVADAAPNAALVEALKGALAVINDYLAYTHDGDPWKEDARSMGEMDINDADNDGRIESWRAALAQAGEVAK